VDEEGDAAAKEMMLSALAVNSLFETHSEACQRLFDVHLLSFETLRRWSRPNHRKQKKSTTN
jgi:hypothetical protein